MTATDFFELENKPDVELLMGAEEQMNQINDTGYYGTGHMATRNNPADINEKSIPPNKISPADENGCTIKT